MTIEQKLCDSSTTYVLGRAMAGPRPDTPASGERKERTMLSAAYGMLAMLPVVFVTAGYVMVSR
jgi:hypothetical protein